MSSSQKMWNVPTASPDPDPVAGLGPGSPRPGRRRLRAAGALVLLTTLCAELTFTAVAVPSAWLLLPLLLVMYGAGVLVVREVVVRVGAGWPGLVVLGLAYQLAEDGLGLQALTSPELYGAADWGHRALGINWSYWESQVGIHVVLSVLLPVMITNLLFPDLRHEPYLRNDGFAAAGVLAVLGVIGLRGIISGTEDPGYQTPWGWTALFVVMIALLGWVTVRVLPRLEWPVGVRSGRKVPRPLLVGFISFYLTTAFLTTLLPLGLGSIMLLGDMMSPQLRLVVAALTAIPFGCLVLRWRTSVDWSDSHRVWMIGGILVSHTAFMMFASLPSVFIGLGVIAVEVVALRALGRYLRRREESPAHP